MCYGISAMSVAGEAAEDARQKPKKGMNSGEDRTRAQLSKRKAIKPLSQKHDKRVHNQCFMIVCFLFIY